MRLCNTLIDALCACTQNLDWLTADMVAGRVVFGQAELEDATRQVMTLVAGPLCAPQLAPTEQCASSKPSSAHKVCSFLLCWWRACKRAPRASSPVVHCT